jgi:hypothetical protein
MRRAAAGVAFVGVASLTACGGHAAAIPPKTLTRANASCSRHDAAIARYEEMTAAASFPTAADIQTIHDEVTMLARLGLGAPLHRSFKDVADVETSALNGTGDAAGENASLLDAKAAAARLGIKCSFGAQPARLFAGG